MGRGQTQKKAGEVVAVAIDNDKGSQHALKWTIDSLVTRGQALTLLQVRQRTAIPTQTTKEVEKAQAKELFQPFRCFCTKKLVSNASSLHKSDSALPIPLHEQLSGIPRFAT
ncbi:hypothetical protein DVH24_002031 [Malus domestica]|uniref:RING-type E3 ubiquitin transferase n=1 Tax=Malus domestica TaxID=3750 RepID=A0A498IBM0_MALDO|nr:hypothetical protein DVH24_002031 [Malus domestica]